MSNFATNYANYKLANDAGVDTFNLAVESDFIALDANDTFNLAAKSAFIALEAEIG